ncbi:MAG: SPFH domain-containing protein [Clostridiales bacterium]|nr:SPFH domain-containing protein [Clostridiales bacterium]
MFDFLTGPIGIGVLIVVILVLIMLAVTGMWRKVPQDKAMVITGLRKRVISGGGGLVIPLFERTDLISLENMQITVNVKGMTSAGVDITVGALTILKIKNVEEKILAAMEQFNTGNTDSTILNIKKTSEEVLEGKLREILSTMTVEEIYKDREKFANTVQIVAAKELEDMGLEIKAFTIKEIRDDQGYLESLGKKQVAEVKKNALIAESNARREQEITIANNEKETATKTAEMRKQTTIQLAIAKQEEEEAQALADVKIANANKDKELIVLANMEETQRKKALADAAYEIEANKARKDIIATQMDAQLVQEDKNVELTTAQMQVQLTREQQETTVATQKAKRRQEELNSEVQKEAEAQAEKTRVLADAELYKRIKEAEAKKQEDIAMAEAEAQKKRLEAEAEAEAVRERAQAAAEERKLAAEAEAEAIRKRGLAEAEAQTAKAKAVEAEGLAEAKVIREKAMAEAEAKEKLAEAYNKYGEAAIMEMALRVLPEITSSVASTLAEPIGKIGDITIVDTGGGSGGSAVGKVTDITAEALTKLPAVIKSLTGIDATKLLTQAVGAFEGKNPASREEQG